MDTILVLAKAAVGAGDPMFRIKVHLFFGGGAL